MSTELALMVGILMLILNGFFVGAEFAILTARRAAIEPLAAAGSRAASTVLWAMENVSLMLACAQLGVTVCSTTLGFVAEPAIAHVLHGPFAAWGLSAAASHAIAFAVALFVVVYLHVLLGEMVPKNLAVAGPDKAVMWFGPPLVLISKVLRPIILTLNWFANHIIRLFGVEPKDEVASAFTAQEVASIVERSQAEGLLIDRHGLLSGALEFSDKRAEDVMVPMGQVATVRLPATVREVEQLINATGFSRVGVCDATGQMAGYVHLKDVLYLDTNEADQTLTRLRTLTQVAPGDEIEAVLAAMLAGRTHLAEVVVAGESVGVVFLEDILEELVGEVRDGMQRKQFGC